MTIKFEKQDDGSYKRTGELPEGTERVWIYRDGRRRNEVMHPTDTYTLEEADNLIRQVRIFMEQLAK